MRIWLICDGDEDGLVVSAAYDSEAIAQDHIDRTGEGFLQSIDVVSGLPKDIAKIDPAAANAEREHAREAARANYRKEAALAAERQAKIEAMTIGPRARLCHCRVFSTRINQTANGYCSYCGGWTAEVFRAAFGDAALSAAIDLLAKSDRDKMRALTGLTTV